MVKRFNYYIIFLAAIGIALGDEIYSSVDNERELAGRKALVTGAAEGIGLAITVSMLKEGVDMVVMIDKNAELGNQASEELNAEYGANKTYFIHAHVFTNFDEAYEIVSNLFGDITIVVNNAGLIDEYDTEDVVETNLLGLMKWSQKFYDILRKDKGGKGGTIINIGSIASYFNAPFMVEYAATKAAVKSYSMNLGHEYNYARTYVRVLGLHPGLTDTSLIQRQMVWDEQVEMFDKFKATLDLQSADCVGKATITIFKNADSGTNWDIIACEDPTESPLIFTVSKQDLESL